MSLSATKYRKEIDSHIEERYREQKAAPSAPKVTPE
jgi:hypothetical protein